MTRCPRLTPARANALVTAWKWKEGEAEFRRALEQNPNSAAAHYFYAYGFLLPENRLDQAQEEFRTALSLDPLSPIVNMNYAVVLMIAKRYPESEAQFQKILESDPSFLPPHYYLSELYAMTGRFSDAVHELQKRTSTPGSWTADAQGYNQLQFALDSQNGPGLAVSSALVGDRNKAFEYLEKAYAVEDDDLILCVRYPVFDPLRSDPRYADLMRRLGLPK